MTNRKSFLLASLSSIAVMTLMTSTAAQAQETPTPLPILLPDIPEASEAPRARLPFDLLATSLGNAPGVPIGGNNAILRFNGLTGMRLDDFIAFGDDPLFNDPRDIVLRGDFLDPTSTFLIHTGQFPSNSGGVFFDTPDFDALVELNLDGTIAGIVGDFSSAMGLTPVNLQSGGMGPLVDAGGGVFGPGGNFFSGSRATGEIIETNPMTGQVLGPINANFSSVDFPRGFVFDAAGNLYLGNGSNPGTGEGADQILFFRNNGDGSFADPVVFAAPEGFSPLDVILSPDGTQLVVSSEFPFQGGATPNDGAIFVFTIDPDNPGAVMGDATILNPVDADGNALIRAPRGLGFGPNGFLFASSTGTDEVFRFDFGTGELADDGAFATTPDLFGQALNFLPLFGTCMADSCDGRFIDLDGFTLMGGGSFTLGEDTVLQGLTLMGPGQDVTINGQVITPLMPMMGSTSFSLTGYGSATINGDVINDSAGGIALAATSNVTPSGMGLTVTLTETGALSATGMNGIALLAASNMPANSGTGGTFNLNGLVITTGDGATSIQIDSSDTALTIGATGQVFATGANSTAIALNGARSTTLINGSVTGAGSVVIEGLALDGSSLRVGPTGLVAATGTDATAIRLISGSMAASSLEVTGPAFVLSTGTGIEVSNDIETTIYGTVVGDATGIRLTDTGAGSASTLTIETPAMVFGAMGSPAIIGSAGDDTVVIRGTVTGIQLAGGNDSLSVDVTSANITGTLYGGMGMDTLMFTGSGMTPNQAVEQFETINFNGGAITLGADLASLGTVNIAGSTDLTLNGQTITAPIGITFASDTSLSGAGTLAGDVLFDGTLAVQPGSLLTVVPYTVTGTLEFNGGIDFDIPNGVNLGALSGTRQTLATSAGLSGGGVDGTHTASTPGGLFTLIGTTAAAGNDLVVDFETEADFSELNFASDNDIRAAIGAQSAFNSGVGAQAELFSLVSETGLQGIRTTSPGFYDGLLQAGANQSDRFQDQIHNRLAAQDVTETGFWAAVLYESFETDRIRRNFGFDVDQVTLSSGFDFTAGPLILGVAASFSRSEVDIDNVTSANTLQGDGDVESVGLAAYLGTQRETGFNASVSAGAQFLETDADRGVGNDTSVASFVSSSFDSRQYFGEVRGSFTIPLTEQWIARPRLGIDVVFTDSESFRETGMSNLALTINTETHEDFIFLLAQDFLYQADGFGVQITGGLRHNLREAGRTIQGRFVGGSFATDFITPVSQTEWFAEGGAQFSLFDGASLEFMYTGRFNDVVTAHAAQARLQFRF